MTTKEKNKILKLSKEGKSVREISELLNLPKSTVGIIAAQKDSVIEYIACPNCGSDFPRIKKDGRPSLFCSHDCKVAYTKRFKTRRHVLCTCKRCGKQFYKYTFTKQKFCCYKCAMDYRYGR